jgi:hypothetical protein
MTRNPLKALFLAALFLAGNLVLPEADILLGHRLGTENESRVHVEPLGGCRNHAEHCVLSRLISDLTGQAPASSLALPVPATTSASLRSADLQSATLRSPRSNHSRAPPAPLS